MNETCGLGGDVGFYVDPQYDKYRSRMVNSTLARALKVRLSSRLFGRQVTVAHARSVAMTERLRADTLETSSFVEMNGWTECLDYSARWN